MTGYQSEAAEIRKGFFENTLPALRLPSDRRLKIHGDWYESTMICLEKFWGHVMPGGIVLIDDYYVWEGCAKAVHSFLAKRQAPERIYQCPIGRVAFILKKAHQE